MATAYIPSKQGSFNTWLLNFNTLITAAPATYGLSAADATTIANATTAWTTAYSTATSGTTRTKGNVANKDAARAAATATVRPYAIAIRNNSGVSNDQKTALGLTVPKTNPTPIPAPSTNPILTIIGATPGSQTVRFADANTPSARAKPFGALQLQLYAVFGIAPAVDPALAALVGTYTKQPIGVSTAGNAGKVVTYFGRWITRTGLIGPWSPAVSMIAV